MSTLSVHSSSFGKKIIFVLLIFWGIFPQLAINVVPHVPVFLLIIILILFNEIVILKKTISDLKGLLFFFMFALAIILSQINAISLSQSILRAIAQFIFLFSIPVMGRWLTSFKYGNTFFSAFTVISIIYLIYISMYWVAGSSTVRNIPISLSLNDIGFNLMIIAIMMFSFGIKRDKSLAIRIMMFSFSIFSIYTLVFRVGSRGALLGLLIAMVSYSIVYLHRRKHIFIYITSAALLFIVVNKVVPIINYDESIMRRYNIFETFTENVPFAIRKSFAKKSFEMLKDYPIFGSGWANFRFYEYNQYSKLWEGGAYRYIGLDNRNPHSNYIRIIGETGLLGSISYLLIVLWIITKLKMLYKKDKDILIKNAAYWLWFPAYLAYSGFHDSFNYFSTVLFIITYSFIYKDTNINKKISIYNNV